MSLIFNGTDILTYCGYVSSSQGKFKTPSREYEVVQIPGKTGDLLISKGRLSNYTVIFDCYINYNFWTNYKGLMKALLSNVGYKTLTDTSDGWTAQAYFLGNVEPEMSPKNKGGKFTLMFSCKPTSDNYL